VISGSRHDRRSEGTFGHSLSLSSLFYLRLVCTTTVSIPQAYAYFMSHITFHLTGLHD